MRQEEPWAGRLFLAPGVLLYLGTGGAAAEHVHHAVQFVCGLDEPVDLVLAGHNLRSRAALIPAGVPHHFDAGSGGLALLLVDPQGRRGSALDRAARKLAGTDVTARLRAVPAPAPAIPAEQAIAWCHDLLTALSDHEEPQEPSPAVLLALSYLDTATESTPRLSDVARYAGISSSRLTHLFSPQVGIPFRRYVVWLRIKRAVDAIHDGANLTDAAASAGFSDSAHLSRVFRATFGLAPSAVLHRMTFTAGLWSPAGTAATFKLRQRPRP